jgi:hypothetical protein
MTPKRTDLLSITRIMLVWSRVLLLLLIRQLLQLVDSARIGDPLVPENGQRLRRTAWLLLAVNVCTVITITMARIFDTGSQMRAELKETI